ncbi:MAG: type I secretion system permease/ATPase [Pseudomonadota bacterium]
MFLRLSAYLLFAVAAIGVGYDAAFNGSGHTGVSATTLGDALGSFGATTSSTQPVSWIQVQDEPIWRRLFSVSSLIPLWFALCVVGALLAWSPSRSVSGHSSIGVNYFGRLTFACLVGLGGLIVLVDATQVIPSGQQPSTTTIGDVWAQSDYASLAAISGTVRYWAGSSFWQWTALPLLRLPLWSMFLAAAWLVQHLAQPGTETKRREAYSATTSSDMHDAQQHKTELDSGGLLAGCSSAFLSAGLLSALVNILMLTGALFMLEVYDRVLPSRSVPTLVALGVIVVVLFAVQILLDIIRNRLLVRIGNLFQRSIATKVFTAQVQLQQSGRLKEQQPEPVQELDTIRSFLASPGPVVLFDLPWLPIYLAIVFALHPWLGWTAVAGALALIALTVATDVASRRPTLRASSAAMRRSELLNEAKRNVESLSVMGMLPRVLQKWDKADSNYLAQQSQISDVSGGFGSTAKGLRLLLQSAVLGVGAFLVIIQEASAGVIIASAILANRALAPLDQAIGQWRNFVAARQSWRRLNLVLNETDQTQSYMALPKPQKHLEMKDVSAVAPGGTELLVKNISFRLQAGQGLGLVGPSGAGKSSIVRLLIGAWKPVRGQVTLDGASIDQWAPEELGRHIGYLPQNVELIEGTIAENISRFDPSARPEDILEAASMAGVHGLITSFPKGYETEVGEQGSLLSVGQRQRIALARAFYGTPFLVVLDEPNSNLDSEGDKALGEAILKIRERGSVVIVVAHRRSALAGVDTLITVHQGQIVASGDKKSVIAKFQKPKNNQTGQSRDNGEAEPTALQA